MSNDNLYNPLQGVNAALAAAQDALDANAASMHSLKTALTELQAAFAGFKAVLKIPADLDEAPADFVPPAEFQVQQHFVAALNGGESNHPVELAMIKKCEDVIMACVCKVMAADSSGNGDGNNG